MVSAVVFSFFLFLLVFAVLLIDPDFLRGFSKRKISKRLVFVNLEFVVVMCITVLLLVAMEGARSCFQSVVCYS